jgi:hypothetical protein
LREALDERAAVVTRAAIMYHQHVPGSAIAVVDPSASAGLDDFDRDARPPRASASNSIGGRNLHDPIGTAVRGLVRFECRRDG